MNGTDSASTPAQTRKVCERCRIEFSCGAAIGDCACFGVSLDDASLTMLRKAFTDCVCVDCLVEIKEKSGGDHHG